MQKKIALLWIFMAFGACIVYAQSTPDAALKSELGGGVVVIHFPAYRGSDQGGVIILPFPYLEYRGDFLKADREGVRGSLFSSDRTELSVSVSGSPPNKSDGIDRRRGMPDLKPSFEIGPQLNILLTSPENKAVTLKIRLPLRQGISLESHPQNAGLTFSPVLNLDIVNPWSLSGANLGFVMGPIFTDKKQNDYFYTVDALYATSTRLVYQARGGYAGTQFLVSLGRKMGDVWMGSYIRYDDLYGSVFENSPLVATKKYLTAGFAISYIFAKF